MSDEPDLLNAAYQALDVERALADVLAAVLDTCFTKDGVFMYEEDTPMPQVVAVLARWREARA